jgi:hypothetical protein
MHKVEKIEGSRLAKKKWSIGLQSGYFSRLRRSPFVPFFNLRMLSEVASHKAVYLLLLRQETCEHPFRSKA